MNLSQPSLNRVAVFIDNSNVFNRIKEKIQLKETGWDCFYDPLYLAQRLAGQRQLTFVGFYCSPPPSYLAQGTPAEQKRYSQQMQYYSEVTKLPNVTVRYGSVGGSRWNLQEKNLDTQITADMITMAAQNKYDVAVLVSNDGDYVSAVRPTKEEFGKKVEVLYFRKRVSMVLRQVCDLPRRARPSFFRRLPNLPPPHGQDVVSI